VVSTSSGALGAQEFELVPMAASKHVESMKAKIFFIMYLLDKIQPVIVPVLTNDLRIRAIASYSPRHIFAVAIDRKIIRVIPVLEF
jgi:hypothetical protein